MAELVLADSNMADSKLGNSKLGDLNLTIQVFRINHVVTSVSKATEFPIFGVDS